MFTITAVNNKAPNGLLGKISYNGVVVGLIHATPYGISITGPHISENPLDAIAINTTEFVFIPRITIYLIPLEGGANFIPPVFPDADTDAH